LGGGRQRSKSRPASSATSAAEWPPLRGVAYDPKDDVLEVALEGIDHLIEHPREI
jgi:hypothetical protein